MFEEIKEWLTAQSITFKQVHHGATETSEAAALARGEDLSIGGKALVLKIDDSFKLCVLSAAKKIDSGALKKHFGAKKLRFADKDELKELTGLVPGSVPPFGKPLIDLELLLDQSILQNQKIAFNAGSLNDSIIMSVQDYLKVSNPVVLAFSKQTDNK
jgi:prolyl-tRNA editing enzyme YbaK/EbsC (Cys-tRNA(Pro) deacylase)